MQSASEKTGGIEAAATRNRAPLSAEGRQVQPVRNRCRGEAQLVDSKAKHPAGYGRWSCKLLRRPPQERRRQSLCFSLCLSCRRPQTCLQLLLQQCSV